jgi:homoserine O-acetyltransferase
MKWTKALSMATAFGLLSMGALAAEEGIYTVPQFSFENGGQLENMKVGYVTFGTLNAAKNNAILVVPGTSGGRHSSDNLIGPGKAFDTDKYFVIGVDPIGGGTSSSPKDGLGSDFPSYTIRDIVRAQHELVTKGLGLTSLVAVGGPSMGSFQGIEWGVTYSGFVESLILIVPAARCDRHCDAIMSGVEAMITLDPAWKNGRYTDNPVEGLRRAGLVYFPWLLSDEYLDGIKSDADFEKAKWTFGEGWAKVWDAQSMIYRYHASGWHDVSKPYGGDMKAALSRVTSAVLIMPSRTDRTVPGYLTQELVSGLKASTFAEIPSIKGHLACCQPEGTPEYEFVSGKIKEFLAGLTK